MITQPNEDRISLAKRLLADEDFDPSDPLRNDPKARAQRAWRLAGERIEAEAKRHVEANRLARQRAEGEAEIDRMAARGER